MPDEHQIIFSGMPDRSGKTTWSQREQWKTLVDNRPHEARFRLLSVVDLTDFSMPEVLSGIGRLLRSHEVLRTTFEEQQPGEPPAQIVHGSGALPIGVIDLPETLDREEANGLAHRLGTGIDFSSDWPARLLLQLREGRPRWLIMTLSHLAVDLLALRLLESELRSTLQTSSQRLPRGRQPLEQAEFEQSPQGRQVLEHSIASWQSGLERVPRALFRRTRYRAPEPRFPELLMSARGLGKRAQNLAVAHGVPISAVFTAAAAGGLARVAGVDRFSMIVTCANRWTPRDMRYIGPIAQQGLMPIEALGESFDEFLQLISKLLTQTRNNSVYDPLALPAPDAEAGEEDFPIDHFVNFMRLDHIVFEGAAKDLRDGETAFTDLDPVRSTRMRFGLKMVTDGKDAEVRMFADGTLFAAEEVAEVCSAIHQIVRDAHAGTLRWPS